MPVTRLECERWFAGLHRALDHLLQFARRRPNKVETRTLIAQLQQGGNRLQTWIAVAAHDEDNIGELFACRRCHEFGELGNFRRLRFGEQPLTLIDRQQEPRRTRRVEIGLDAALLGCPG